MRYEIKSVKETDEKRTKYYIFDTVSKHSVSNLFFDIIIGIFEDKFAVVGIKLTDTDYHYHYDYYKYGLLNMEGNLIYDIKYDLIYPCSKGIFLYKNGILNLVNYSGLYIWENEKGMFLSEKEFLDNNNKYAIIFGEDNEYGKTFKIINTEGVVVKEFQSDSNNRYSSSYYAPILLGDYTYFENEDDNYYNDFSKDKKWTKEDVKTKSLFWKDKKVDLLGRGFVGIFHNNFMVFSNAIFNDKLKLIYYSQDEIRTYPNYFYDRLVINDRFILDTKGKIYLIPKDYYYSDSIHYQNNGYSIIRKDHIFGFINNKAEIIVPVVFPEKVMRCRIDNLEDEDLEWQQTLIEMNNSYYDAFDGDPEAEWNVN